MKAIFIIFLLGFSASASAQFELSWVNSSVQENDAKLIKSLAKDDISSYQVLWGDAIFNAKSQNIVNNLKSLKWYEKAMEQGDSLAMHRLAYIYSKEEYEIYNLEKSFEFLLKSAHAGLKESRIELGRSFLDTTGRIETLKPSLRDCFNWFEMAGSTSDYYSFIKESIPNFKSLSQFLRKDSAIVPGLNIIVDKGNFKEVEAFNLALKENSDLFSNELFEEFKNKYTFEFLGASFEKAKGQFNRLSDFQHLIYSNNWLEPQSADFKIAVHTSIKKLVDYENDPQVRVYNNQISGYDSTLASEFRKSYLDYKSSISINRNQLLDLQEILYSSHWLDKESTSYKEKVHSRIITQIDANNILEYGQYISKLKSIDSPLAEKVRVQAESQFISSFIQDLDNNNDVNNLLKNTHQLLEKNVWLNNNINSLHALVDIEHLRRQNLRDTSELNAYLSFLTSRSLYLDSTKLVDIDKEVIGFLMSSLNSIPEFGYFINWSSSYGIKNKGLLKKNAIQDSSWFAFYSSWFNNTLKLEEEGISYFIELQNNVLNFSKKSDLSNILIETLRESILNLDFDAYEINLISEQVPVIFNDVFNNADFVLKLELKIFNSLNLDSKGNRDLYYSTLYKRQSRYHKLSLDRIAIPLYNAHNNNSTSFDEFARFLIFSKNKRWLNDEVKNPEIAQLKEDVFKKMTELGITRAEKAIEQDDVNELKYLIVNGFPIDQKLDNGFSLIAFSNIKNALFCSKYLSKLGAEISKSDSLLIRNANSANSWER